jgi:hypothetical protein
MEAAGELSLPGRIEQESERLPWLELLGAVIISPRKAFRQLADHPQWLLPSIILFLWLLLFASGFLAQIITVFSQMPKETKEALPRFERAFVVVMSIVQIGTGTLALAVVFLLMTATLYLLCRLFRFKSRLFPLISGLAFAEFVPRLTAQSVKEIAALLSDNPMFMFGWSLHLYLNAWRRFSSIDFPIYLWPLLNRLDPFHLWSFALVVILVQVMAGVSLKKGVLVTAIYWCICTAAVMGFFYGLEIIGEIMGSAK